MGDYFELLGALVAAGVDVKTVGQSDLMRVAFPPKFKAANLDNTQLVLNGGAGINMGGTASYKGVQIELVPAVHSTAAGYPRCGVHHRHRRRASLRVGRHRRLRRHGARRVALPPGLGRALHRERRVHDGPDDAALACKLLGIGHAIPVHYAHNPLVVGPQCGDLFRAAVARVSPQTAVTLVRPGDTTTLRIATNAARMS